MQRGVKNEVLLSAKERGGAHLPSPLSACKFHPYADYVLIRAESCFRNEEVRLYAGHDELVLSSNPLMLGSGIDKMMGYSAHISYT